MTEIYWERRSTPPEVSGDVWEEGGFFCERSLLLHVEAHLLRLYGRASSPPANRLASNHIRPLHRHQQSDARSVSEAPSQGANTHHEWFSSLTRSYRSGAHIFLGEPSALPEQPLPPLRFGQA